MPEKTVDQIPAAQREMFDKGVAALQKNNLDYAVTLLFQVLKNEPGFYECREALRAAQHRRTGNRGGEGRTPHRLPALRPAGARLPGQPGRARVLEDRLDADFLVPGFDRTSGPCLGMNEAPATPAFRWNASGLPSVNSAG